MLLLFSVFLIVAGIVLGTIAAFCILSLHRVIEEGS